MYQAIIVLFTNITETFKQISNVNGLGQHDRMKIFLAISTIQMILYNIKITKI